MLGLGFALWATAGWQASYPGLVVAGLIVGLGNGVLLAVNNTVLMGCLPRDARGVASGMLETTRHFGHAFGVTIPTAILAIVLAAAVPTPEAEALAMREGFFWACLALAGLAWLGAAISLIRPQP